MGAHTHICLRVYAPTGVHACTDVYQHVHIKHVHTYTCICTRMPTHMHMGTYVNLLWCTCIHVDTHACSYLYGCTPISMHAHTRVHICSQAYTHTCTHRFLYCGHSMLGSGTVVLHLARRFRSPSPADGCCCMCEQLCGSLVAAAWLCTIVQTVCKQFPGPADSPLSVSTKLTS